MRKVSILGSTGSIGNNTLDIIKSHPDKFVPHFLSASSSVEELARQVNEFKPKFAGIFNKNNFDALKSNITSSDTKILCGEDEIIAFLQSEEVDVTMSSIVGVAGLKPTYAALSKSKIMALANKESLVCAGEVINKRIKEVNCKLVPVDSEHSAIYQCFESDKADLVDNITLTASGGPFRNKSLEEMVAATPEQAVAHPNWKMGAKISVDSATLLNKGLEFIEACMLFPIKPKDIEVVVHPESIIHSMVTYKDGSTLAQLSIPDMRVPISYALSYPKRVEIAYKRLDLTELQKLTFYKPDYQKFPLLKLAQETIEMGSWAMITLNTANEIAVANFLKKKIAFLDIAKTVKYMIDKGNVEDLNSIEDVINYSNMIAIKTQEYINNL
jgi:1-deoxy-D-xylulose-5-phosphate reductoisomerase